MTVSYTHLDVYKRQHDNIKTKFIIILSINDPNFTWSWSEGLLLKSAIRQGNYELLQRISHNYCNTKHNNVVKAIKRHLARKKRKWTAMSSYYVCALRKLPLRFVSLLYHSGKVRTQQQTFKLLKLIKNVVYLIHFVLGKVYVGIYPDLLGPRRTYEQHNKREKCPLSSS